MIAWESKEGSDLHAAAPKIHIHFMLSLSVSVKNIMISQRSYLRGGVILYIYIFVQTQQ